MNSEFIVRIQSSYIKKANRKYEVPNSMNKYNDYKKIMIIVVC